LRDALAQRRGVCQDFAHVMLGLCRALKMPARYVSGYLAVEKARATHAWVEVWIPTAGWLALDPTHNRQIDETYIKIGAGRDYADVPPVAGYYRGTMERKLEVDVQIEALRERAHELSQPESYLRPSTFSLDSRTGSQCVGSAAVPVAAGRVSRPASWLTALNRLFPFAKRQCLH
jgi:hypothetical protein